MPFEHLNQVVLLKSIYGELFKHLVVSFLLSGHFLCLGSVCNLQIVIKENWKKSVSEKIGRI